MKSIKDLIASDFPSLDPQKFLDWKTASLESQVLIKKAINRGNWILWPPIILTLLFRSPISFIILIIALISWILYMFLYIKPIGNKARELMKVAGIDRTMLKHALSNQTKRSTGLQHWVCSKCGQINGYAIDVCSKCANHR